MNEAVPPYTLARIREHQTDGNTYGHCGQQDIGLLLREIDRLNDQINTPHTHDFLEAVRLEMPHQRERWGTEHDVGKTSADWFWLVGFLAGKALMALTSGNLEKGKHHIITATAALGNWFLAITGENTRMRPGIATPKGEPPPAPPDVDGLLKKSL